MERAGYHHEGHEGAWCELLMFHRQECSTWLQRRSCRRALSRTARRRLQRSSTDWESPVEPAWSNSRLEASRASVAGMTRRGVAAIPSFRSYLKHRTFYHPPRTIMAATHKSDRFNIPQFPANAVLVVPSNSTDLSADAVGGGEGVVVYVTVTGNLTLTPLGGGSDIVLTAVPAFTVIPFRVSKVKAATTATCVAIY